MSERVDVLAVMERCANAVEAYSTKIVFREEGFVSECSDGGLRKARAAVAELFSALDQIGGLSRALRVGGPDPMDLQELSDALSEAIDIAHAALSRFGAAP